MKTDDCWLWQKSKTKQGYGQTTYKKKRMYTHRVSWTIHNGEIPDGAQVLHKCDTPPCVNPDHLFLGTNRDNVDDKIAKGRVPLGEQASGSKLTQKQVLEIRKLHAEGLLSQGQLGRNYGVSDVTINNIVHRRQWKHI